MFETKKSIKEQLINVNIERANLEKENNLLKKSIKNFEESQKDLRHDIEREHIENYKQHRKLLNIQELIDKTAYGTYIDLLKFRNKIKKELANDYQSDN